MEHGISRRSVLKGACLLAAAAAAPLGYSLFNRSESGVWVLATNQAARDADEFASYAAKALNAALPELSVDVQPLPRAGSVRQDLTLIQGGVVRDLSADAGAYADARAFMASLRERTGAATHIIQLQRRSADSAPYVEFTVDGGIVERVSADRNYNNIIVPGRLGDTHFRLIDGALQVTSSCCRHKTCERMGPKSAGSLVCAPNGLAVKLPGRLSVDAVTA